MADYLVQGFQKVLSVDKNVTKYGSVIIKLKGIGQARRYDFEKKDINLFLAFVHMLEHDIVYYSDNGLFTSSREYRKPPQPTPMA